MYNIYFDVGTSNMRAYLVKDREIVDVLRKNVGIKDSSIAGSNLVLLKGLKELYDGLLKNNMLEESQVSGVYASGMITSSFGVKEVPHLPTPISLENLCSTIYTHFEDKLLKRDMHLIRGAKTVPDGFKADMYNIAGVNNTRGEEIEVFGILASAPENWREQNLAIVLPGSHTHIIYVRQGVLQDILSTFSGELFHAVSTSTILAGSLRYDEERLDEEAVKLGYRYLKEYGINRALYITRATSVFNACGDLERHSYLDGVITGGTVIAFEKMINSKWHNVDRVIVAGNSNSITRVYELILNEMDRKLDIDVLTASGKESFAVKGFIEILKLGGV